MTATQLNILAAVFAFVAAILWLVSATVQVEHKDKVDAEGWVEASITSDGKDVIASAKLQQKWSRRGAYAAAVAAALQGAALVISACAT
jgi:hypothetical protein